MNYDVLKIWTIFSRSVLIKRVLITKKVCTDGGSGSVGITKDARDLAFNYVWSFKLLLHQI